MFWSLSTFGLCICENLTIILILDYLVKIIEGRLEQEENNQVYKQLVVQHFSKIWETQISVQLLRYSLYTVICSTFEQNYFLFCFNWYVELFREVDKVFLKLSKCFFCWFSSVLLKWNVLLNLINWSDLHSTCKHSFIF